MMVMVMVVMFMAMLGRQGACQDEAGTRHRRELVWTRRGRALKKQKLHGADEARTSPDEAGAGRKRGRTWAGLNGNVAEGGAGDDGGGVAMVRACTNDAGKKAGTGSEEAQTRRHRAVDEEAPVRDRTGMWRRVMVMKIVMVTMAHEAFHFLLIPLNAASKFQLSGSMAPPFHFLGSFNNKENCY
jgi:hypothetical protein